jgi:hypothetical protein
MSFESRMHGVTTVARERTGQYKQSTEESIADAGAAARGTPAQCSRSA